MEILTVNIADELSENAIIAILYALKIGYEI